MPRTAGAKDTKKRTRRSMTEREKKKRKDDKQRLTEAANQAAKARFVATLAAPAAVDTAEDNTPQEQQPDVAYEEVAVNECRGTTDLGSIAAEFDDEWDEDGATDSVMKAYVKAIMNRYVTEDSPDFQKKHPNGETWLQEFLNGLVE